MPLLSQDALDEGLRLHQALCEATAEENFLLRSLGSEVATSLLKTASDALSESQTAMETLSRCLVRQNCTATSRKSCIKRFKMLFVIL